MSKKKWLEFIKEGKPLCRLAFI